MTTIAFATCAARPGVDDDDLLLVAALEARGVDVEPVVWDAAGVDWGRFAAVVVRSTWDYHHHRPRFLAWAESVDARTTLVNPLSAIRWNTHKRYLRELEARGVAIVPTAWIDAHTQCRLEGLLAERAWDRDGTSLVVKPAVSNGADRTLRFDSGNVKEAQRLLDAIITTGDALVQPYLTSVEAYGERSLVFFDGHFSHAIRKCPALGPDPEDRPMKGREQTVIATDDELLFSASVLHAAAGLTAPPAYARVDIVHDGMPRLMELEIVEPSLFFRANARGRALLSGADLEGRSERDGENHARGADAIDPAADRFAEILVRAAAKRS